MKFRVAALLQIFLSSVALAAAADVSVRLRFGMRDSNNTAWDGRASVAPGAVERIDGWRFQATDRIIDAQSWQASTRPVIVRRTNNPEKMSTASSRAAELVDNGVLIVRREVNEEAVVKIQTKQGDFSFRLAEIPYGTVIERLRGAVDIERIATTRPLTETRNEEDFPALAVARDGATSVAWISFKNVALQGAPRQPWTRAPGDLSFLAQPPGGDQLWLRTQRNGEWSAPLAITTGGRDLFKCAVAIDGENRTWVFWSENTGWPANPLANFEIFAASVTDGRVSEPVKLSDHPGSDLAPVATTDAAGKIWVAWQAARNNVFRIVERHQSAAGRWTVESVVSAQAGNCWAPAIAAAADGRVGIGWDTYDKGDYDIWVREYAKSGAPMPARPVAVGAHHEALPSLTYDPQSRLWIAWEYSADKWGKDWGADDFKSGISVYQDRQIGLIVLAGNTWLEPSQPVTTGLPNAEFRRGFRDPPAPAKTAAPSRKPGEKAEAKGAYFNSLARITCDRDGRIWVLSRTREGAFGGAFVGSGGSVWISYAACYDGRNWLGPTVVPQTDNIISNWPALAAHPAGGVVVAHSTDHRQMHTVARAGRSAIGLYFSRLEMPAATITPQLRPAAHPPGAPALPSRETLDERAAVTRARAQRIRYDGKALRLLRGEFHRHTELSGDGKDDGSLDDMWRYGIDVSAMDWLGNGDHDSSSREYSWWLTQKTTDAFRLPGRFDPVFSHERSLPYPDGHRNPVFAQRGVRHLPRLPRGNPDVVASSPDTQMLYAYLRHFNGVCASHTSATGMGTDWRDNAPDVEPMVEVYQGARQNYERPGAPRAPNENDALGGWRPLGFINLAFLKGYRFSFQASSDHYSNHISYAMVYAEDTSREAILRAMRARHTYASTDNIVADLRCEADGRDYMLGDEFTTTRPPTLRLKLHGTAAFAKVTLVKDDVEIQVATPGTAAVELTWTDPAPVAGKTSYYYFRGEQSDGELVWVSPMWITYAPTR